MRKVVTVDENNQLPATTKVSDGSELALQLKAIAAQNPGPKGDPGKDGFPSQEQWNALVARVEALETPAG